MTKIKKLYSYYASSGLEVHPVERCTTTSVVVPCGISGEVIRRTEIDVAGARYFTTPTAAIEAFIVKAETAIADPTRCTRGDRSLWLKCLNAARVQLRLQQSA